MWAFFPHHGSVWRTAEPTSQTWWDSRLCCNNLFFSLHYSCLKFQQKQLQTETRTVNSTSHLTRKSYFSLLGRLETSWESCENNSETQNCMCCTWWFRNLHKLSHFYVLDDSLELYYQFILFISSLLRSSTFFSWWMTKQVKILGQ